MPNGDDASRQLDDHCLETIEFGRELRAQACELRRQGLVSISQLNLLRCAFSMLAYADPQASPFADVFDRQYVENLCESVNSAILVHLKKPPVPELEHLIGLLDQVTCGKASQVASLPMDVASSARTMNGQAPLLSPLFDPFTTPAPPSREDSNFHSLFQPFLAAQTPASAEPWCSRPLSCAMDRFQSLSLESPQSAPPTGEFRTLRVLRRQRLQQEVHHHQQRGTEFAGFFHPSLFFIRQKETTNGDVL
ncbi:Ran-binding protein 9 [Cichlidogyrus casuarinus]|uniref:Ran-binding protein 9 n=1 Tax=Cichlidogyrus casuarinus TaxID=1844966 RepID=A0ABD2PIU3_9PLAT